MNTLPYKVRVVQGHAGDHTKMIAVRAGDEVTVGHRNVMYPEYVWCASQSGHGWVPVDFLEMTGPQEARVLHDFVADELTVVPGEILDVVEDLGSWLRCRDSNGVEGEVPAAIVEQISE